MTKCSFVFVIEVATQNSLFVSFTGARVGWSTRIGGTWRTGMVACIDTHDIW